MKLGEFKEKTKKAVSKAGKKTVIATMAVFVIGIAVLLNLILASDAKVGTLSDELSEVAGLLGEENGVVSTESEEYFANIVLNRQSARDEAMAVLLSVTDSETAIEEVKNSAYSDMEQIAQDIESEANIETMILAKGFEQCIAVVNGKSANVIVKTEGLTPGEVAQISEIVYEECGILPSELKIIEKN
ncbi:MAG: SpoIIIAH-like family protein [Ruminococcaceae bacterium]|nr:SpoIIIAH-like family protein [Oscillospiraceae bacterium]